MKLPSHHASRVAFELRNEVRHGKRRVAFHKQVNVVGHHFHRVNLRPYLIRLLS